MELVLRLDHRREVEVLKIPVTYVHQTPEAGRSLFTIETRSYRLTPGAIYTLSMYMKADKPRDVQIGLQGLGPIGKDQRGRPKLQPDIRALAKRVRLGTEWTRYSVTGALPEVACGLYHLSADYHSEDPTPGFAWI